MCLMATPIKTDCVREGEPIDDGTRAWIRLRPEGYEEKRDRVLYAGADLAIWRLIGAKAS